MHQKENIYFFNFFQKCRFCFQEDSRIRPIEVENEAEKLPDIDEKSKKSGMEAGCETTANRRREQFLWGVPGDYRSVLIFF